jgi:hypothetical protein
VSRPGAPTFLFGFILAVAGGFVLAGGHVVGGALLVGLAIWCAVAVDRARRDDSRVS